MTLHNLNDPAWRLDHLYTIVDKYDHRLILRRNSAQQIVHEIQHPKTIILKSRQRGISTFKVAENLDKCIFNPDTQAGIQSYGQSESKKLYKKAMLMWEEFDPDIVELLNIKLTSANGEGLTFSNGSQLKIGNFRGDTLSSFHISELAKIAAKFPEKAEEIKSGALEAVATHSTVSIESTAEGAAGMFFDYWQEAVRRLQLVGAENLTPQDYYPVFLSWMDDPDCSMTYSYPANAEDEEYFKLVEAYTHKPLTQEQKYWAAAKRQKLGELFDREYPYSPEAAFRMSVEGTYYKLQYERLIKEKRVAPQTYSSKHPVYAIFDLGMNDTMAVNFTQVINGVPRILGEYENTGHNIEYYVKIMQMLPYTIDIVYLPHDANVRELQTGRTRLQEFRRLGCICHVLKKQSIQDGINAARQYLDIVEIDPSCKETIDAIQNYRQKFDRKNQVFMGQPEHNKFSHFADVVRYSALALTYSKVRGTIPETLEEKFSRRRKTGVAL